MKCFPWNFKGKITPPFVLTKIFTLFLIDLLSNLYGLFNRSFKDKLNVLSKSDLTLCCRYSSNLFVEITSDLIKNFCSARKNRVGS